MTPNSTAAAVSTIESVFNTAKTYTDIMGKSKNLIDVAKPLQVEPYLFIDNSLIYSTDFLPDVVQTLQSQFTGFWLTGVDVIADVAGAQALSILDVVNPSRNSGYFDFVKKMHDKMASRESLYYSREAYKFGLPTNTSHQVMHQSLENNKDKIGNINDVSNLALGKMVNVTLGKGDDKRDFRVSIRLLAVDLDKETLTNFAVDRSAAASLTNRISSWLNGEIGLADLVFCLDLGRERRRQLLKDKAGIYQEVNKRRMGHKRAGLFSGVASAAEASNLVILSREFTEELQARHGLDIEDAKDRQKIMDNMLAMIIAVVDRRDLRVKFFYAGMNKGSSMGINDIRISNRKQSGPDLMDIFAAIKEGAPPRY